MYKRQEEGYTDEEIRALCHSKDHDCAVVVEHPVWGKGKPIHGSHAIPTDDGYVEWYDVQFKHGIEEKVMASDMEILEESQHNEEMPKTKNGKMENIMAMMKKMPAKQVEKLANADVKGLRKDKHYRQQFANDAKSILNKLGSIQYADSTAQYGADQESSGSSSSGSSGNGTQQTDISPGGPVLRQPDVHAENSAGRNYPDDGDQWNASVLQR